VRQRGCLDVEADWPRVPAPGLDDLAHGGAGGGTGFDQHCGDAELGQQGDWLIGAGVPSEMVEQLSAGVGRVQGGPEAGRQIVTTCDCNIRATDAELDAEGGGLPEQAAQLVPVAGKNIVFSTSRGESPSELSELSEPLYSSMG
jgi:hypothetical protein